MSDAAKYLSDNLRALRTARGLTQSNAARLAGLPRPTWSSLESDSPNPTLAVLSKVSQAFQVRLEELLAPPKASARHYPKSGLVVRVRGSVEIRKLLPDPLPGLDLERLSLPPGGRLVGIPHTAGTTEYLACEQGELELVASGKAYALAAGDVVVFRGDQKHSYRNLGRGHAVGYSVIVLSR